MDSSSASIAGRLARRSSWVRGASLRSFEALLRNEVAYIVVPGFAQPDECAKLSAAADALGFDPYRFVEPPIDRIGITAFEYAQDAATIDRYFADVPRARALREKIFAASFDPIARLRTVLAQAHHTVEIMRDPQHGDYYAGLARRIEAGTLLHIDYAPIEQPAWHVANVQEQLVWNVYTEVSPQSGSTYIYKRPIVATDARHKLAGTYGYAREVVRGAECAVYEPKLGELCIFNTRNFHEVEPSRGKRMTFTSAMGLIEPGRLAIWS